MANIAEYLKNILSARYGRDVRQSIHDAIKEVDRVADTAQNSASQSAKQAQESAEAAESAASRAEMVQASIPADYDELSQNVDELNVKVDTIIEKAELNIKNTASGETIHVTDSADSKVVEFGLHGKAEQEQYSGNQLLELEDLTTVYLGLTLVVDGGKSKITGTSTGVSTLWYLGSYDDTNIKMTLEAGTYTVTDCVLWSYDGTNHQNYTGTFTITENLNITGVSTSTYASGVTVTENRLPMLNKGATALTWESYVGGKPSPSPSYPQDIEVAGASGSVEVKSVGKNLLKNTVTSQTINGVTITVNEDKSITANGTATNNLFLYIVDGFNFYSNKSYKLSGCPASGSDNGYSIRVFNRTNKSFIDYGNGVDIHNFECENAQVFIRIASGTVCNNLTFYPMIRLASDTDDTYEPYTETTATISTPDGIAGINGVYDEVVKYADGSGKRIQRIGKAVFDGSDDEGWYMTTSRNKYRPTIAIPIKADNTIYDIANILCTHYQAKSSADTYEEIEGIASSLHSVIFIYDSNYNTNDISLWKAHLAENPITVWYELETPIITDLTAEEIAEIEKLHTFYPVTNISNDADCGMAVTYLADSKNYIDNQLALQAQAQEEALLNMLLLMPEEVQASMIENDTNNLLNEAEV